MALHRYTVIPFNRFETRRMYLRISFLCSSAFNQFFSLESLDFASSCHISVKVISRAHIDSNILFSVSYWFPRVLYKRNPINIYDKLDDDSTITVQVPSLRTKNSALLKYIDCVYLIFVFFSWV